MSHSKPCLAKVFEADAKHAATEGSTCVANALQLETLEILERTDLVMMMVHDMGHSLNVLGIKTLRNTHQIYSVEAAMPRSMKQDRRV